MSQTAQKTAPLATLSAAATSTPPAPLASPLGNLLAARVAAQARAQQNQQLVAPRQPVSLTPIRPSAVSPLAIATPSPAAPAPVPIILPHGQLAPTELVQHVRSAVRLIHKGYAEVIFYGTQLAHASAWIETGFATEEEFVASLGISYTSWRDYLTLGERLDTLGCLTLDTLLALSVNTLRTLSRVHPSIWAEYAWLEEAKALPAREFAMLTQQRNHEHLPNSSQLAEPRANMQVAVPLSQQAILQRRLDTLRRRERLATTGDTLIYALEQADRAGELETGLAAIEKQAAELARLWKPGEPWSAGFAESEAERRARYTSDDPAAVTSLTEAAERTQQLARSIARTLRGLGLEPESDQASNLVAEEAVHGKVHTQEIRSSDQASTSPTL